MPTIKLPKIRNAKSATVQRWLKKAGDAVQQGEVLLAVETEDSLAEIESPASGVLARITLAEGQTGAVDAEIGVIDAAAAPVATQAPAAQSAAAPAASSPKPAAATGGPVIPILMPQAGQSMEEGTLVKWNIKPGDRFTKGQIIFVIETDKATVDVEAVDEGRLAKIVVNEGEVVPVKVPVGFIAENDADVEGYAAGGAAPSGATSEEASKSEIRNLKSEIHSGASPSQVTATGRVKASPAARKAAAAKGIDLAAIPTGSGPGGRIISTDVLNAQHSAPSTGASAGGRRKMSSMRKAIGKNLLWSKQNIPHIYLRLTVNADPMFAFYKAQKAKYPCTVNDVVTAAVARGVREFPAFRSRIDGEFIVEMPDVNIGIAVGMDEGLVVPVLVNADRMSLQQVGAETRRMAESARNGKIEGMGKGVFTITNLGMFGVEEFAGIINPPEVAILAVGAARESVIVANGAMKIGRVMTMTLSGDHRMIDGVAAAKFLAKMKELLESPEQLV